MLLQLKRWFNATVAAGADSAMFSFPIPDESSLVQQQGEFKILTVTPIDIADAVIYGIQGWILRSDTPSTDFLDHDTLWDSMVPKETDTVVIIAAPGSTASAAQEPGQIAVAQVFNQEIFGEKRIFSREELITLPDNPIGFVPGTPSLFHPSDKFSLIDNNEYRVHDDSGLVYGISSPDLAGLTTDDDVIDVVGSGSASSSMYMMKYINEFMDKALVDLLGLHETGAESPYEDIMDWLVTMLERGGEITGAGAFTAVSWNGLGKMTAGIRVPGNFPHTTIGPSGQAR